MNIKGNKVYLVVLCIYHSYTSCVFSQDAEVPNLWVLVQAVVTDCLECQNKLSFSKILLNQPLRRIQSIPKIFENKSKTRNIKL